jgi:cytochrome c-type biogenesis protein
MVETPSLFLAFAAGFVSFVSPCCLPLVPGYLATVSGGAPEGERRVNARVIARSLLFIASFSAVFILLGLSATAIGSFLFSNQTTLRHVSGIAIIVMGVLFVASMFVLRLNRDWRPPGLAARAGRGGPVVIGVAFALAWTPCVGPTLGAILGLAASHSSTAQAAGLLAVYSAGLGVPFLLSAVAFDRAQSGFAWFKRHHAAIQVVSGLVLIGMGVLVLENQLFRINIEVQQALDRIGGNFFQSL